MKKIITISLLSLSILSAQTDICQTQWIQADGKKYTPPENVKTLKITFINELDGIEMSTKNHTSKYAYRSFLDIDGHLGISYKAKNGDILDIFQNGNLVIWRDKVPQLKAHCPTMKLDISKNKFTGD